MADEEDVPQIPNLGWIKLWRAIRENKLWKMKPFSPATAWIDIILRAAWKEHKVIYQGYVVNLARGQMIASLRQLGRDWGWDHHRARRQLQIMADLDMIRPIEHPAGMLITVCNYERYQSDEELAPPVAPSSPQARPTDVPRSPHERRSMKEEKEVKKAGPPFSPPSGGNGPTGRTDPSDCPTCRRALKREGVFMVRPADGEPHPCTCNPADKIEKWEKHQAYLKAISKA